MKLRYKHQRFQENAARCVVDAFIGHPKSDGLSNFMVDPGKGDPDGIKFDMEGFGNQEIVLAQEDITENIRAVQMQQGIRPVEHLEQLQGVGTALTIEMETGTGKTYTYIKTMFELNKQYGWTKFVIVVPSIAIREGVYKSFLSMEEHFALEYGKRMQYFIYNSKQLAKIDSFASDPGIHVMIINTQAFNTSMNEDKNKEGRGGDNAARIIFSRRDEFRSRRPIDILSATRPIMIIDEPQSVLGSNKANATRKGLALFRPLFTLLYSATHRQGDIYNMVYRLDAIDAYNKHLVKKIEVKGISQKGSTATNDYLYLEEIVLSKGNPQARIGFDIKTANGTKQTTKLVSEGWNLYEQSGELEEYKDGYIIERIDGMDGSIHLLNGIQLSEGEAIGKVNEDLLRRIQIKETIRTHIERERQLFQKHIKVLSLFFIDHVSSYKLYGDEVETDSMGNSDARGKFAKMFEEEYHNVVRELMPSLTDGAYSRYLSDPRNAAEQVHQGYFSKDKKGRMIDPKLERGTTDSNDESAFDLIMKDKERLLSFEEPVRFIFSHSALKEGWDNPNVFQICTLKDSDNTTKKRQEVGRGMRLCVNDKGERQDADVLGEEHVFDTNVLTVIASESYENFATSLQHEIAEACADRPVKVTVHLFEDKQATLSDGSLITINRYKASDIYDVLVMQQYIKHGELTDKYYDDKLNGTLFFGDQDDVKTFIVSTLATIYNPKEALIDNARKAKESHFIKDNFEKKQFQDLWRQINARTYYTVKFETQKLIQSAIKQIDKLLSVTEIRIIVERGKLEGIADKEQLVSASAMTQGKSRTIHVREAVGSNVKYDLIGKLVESTGLTRRTIVSILQGIKPATFKQFSLNPEEFIIKVARIINDCKATAVVQHITYNKREGDNGTYSTDIFSESILKGKLGINAIESKKSLYDLVVVDSTGIEMSFAEKLEKQEEVVVYTKLPRGFYINTPMGRYNPDWAVVFREGSVKHIYFIAETKGEDLLESDLRTTEQNKIACARKHFEAISHGDVVYDVVKTYDSLYNKVMK